MKGSIRLTLSTLPFTVRYNVKRLYEFYQAPEEVILCKIESGIDREFSIYDPEEGRICGVSREAVLEAWSCLNRDQKRHFLTRFY